MSYRRGIWVQIVVVAALITLFVEIILCIELGGMGIRPLEIEVSDINGQPGLIVSFITLKEPLIIEAIGPEANLLDFKIVRRRGIVKVELFLGPPGYNIPGGAYFVIFRDEAKRILMASNIVLEGPKLELLNSAVTLQRLNGESLLNVSFLIINQGDAPAYIDRIVVYLNSEACKECLSHNVCLKPGGKLTVVTSFRVTIGRLENCRVLVKILGVNLSRRWKLMPS